MVRLLKVLEGFLLATYVANPVLESFKAASTTLVINEIDYDQPGVDYSEFIEILNIGESVLSLSDYEMWLVDAKENIYNKFSLSNVSLSSSEYFVICSTNANHVLPCNQPQEADSSQSDVSINLIRNKAGSSIVLVHSENHTIIDSVTYGSGSGGGSSYTETDPAMADPSTMANVSIGRCPDGANTFNNSHDFSLTQSSSGKANICSGNSSSDSPLPYSPPSPSSPPLPPSSSAFDFYFLSTQWPGSWSSSFCSDSVYGWNPQSPMWTIHGLWPNYYSGSYPTYCNPNPLFNESVLNADGLMQDMVRFWPSYSCSSSNADETFWKHEWSKHGTCAESFFSYNNRSVEFNYFDRTTRSLFLSQPNLYNVLANSSILPGGSYSTESISVAIQNGLGLDLVSLHCSSSSMISEIRFCVSLDLEIISCNSTWLGQPSCGSSVYYPLCNNTGASC